MSAIPATNTGNAGKSVTKPKRIQYGTIALPDDRHVKALAAMCAECERFKAWFGQALVHDFDEVVPCDEEVDAFDRFMRKEAAEDLEKKIRKLGKREPQPEDDDDE